MHGMTAAGNDDIGSDQDMFSDFHFDIIDDGQIVVGIEVVSDEGILTV